MKVSEKQLLVMLDALRAAAKVSIAGGSNPFTYERDTYAGILTEIVNQQSNVIVDVKGDEPKEVSR